MADPATARPCSRCHAEPRAGTSGWCRRCIAGRMKSMRAERGPNRAYITWQAIIQRCTNPRSHAWKDYGGRGITVCERWRVFENFLADMGEKPVGRSIDRIDNDGNYEPGNCRWATGSEQQRNKRPVNKKFAAHGAAESAEAVRRSAAIEHGRARMAASRVRAAAVVTGG
jgi:hypothetical protein